MNLNFLNKLPKSIKRAAIQSIAEALKNLLRVSHADEALQDHEEDFALLLYQRDKTKADSALLATLVAVDATANVTRHIKTYVVDDLIKTLEKKV